MFLKIKTAILKSYNKPKEIQEKIEDLPIKYESNFPSPNLSEIFSYPLPKSLDSDLKNLSCLKSPKKEHISPGQFPPQYSDYSDYSNSSSQNSDSSKTSYLSGLSSHDLRLMDTPDLSSRDSMSLSQTPIFKGFTPIAIISPKKDFSKDFSKGFSNKDLSFPLNPNKESKVENMEERDSKIPDFSNSIMSLKTQNPKCVKIKSKLGKGVFKQVTPNNSKIKNKRFKNSKEIILDKNENFEKQYFHNSNRIKRLFNCNKALYMKRFNMLAREIDQTFRLQDKKKIKNEKNDEGQSFKYSS